MNRALSGLFGAAIPSLKSSLVPRTFSTAAASTDVSRQAGILLREKKFQEIMNLKKEVDSQSEKPNLKSTFFNAVMAAQSHVIKNFGEAKTATFKILEEMQEAKVQPDHSTYRRLIFACLNANDVEKAKELFIEMRGKNMSGNLAMYDSMIFKLGRLGDVDSCLVVMQEMAIWKIAPDQGTFRGLFTGCRTAKRLDMAISGLKELKFLNIPLDSRMLDDLVTTSHDCGNWELCFELYSELCTEHITPSLDTISMLFRAAERLVSTDKLIFAMNELAKHTTILDKDVLEKIWKSTVQIAMRARRADVALQVLEDIASRPGLSTQHLMDSYLSALKVCSSTGDAQNGLKCFEQMKAKGLKLMAPHYSFVINSVLGYKFPLVAVDGTVVEKNDAEQARANMKQAVELFFEMEKLGVPWTEHVLAALLQSCLLINDVTRAIYILECANYRRSLPRRGDIAAVRDRALSPALKTKIDKLFSFASTSTKPAKKE